MCEVLAHNGIVYRVGWMLRDLAALPQFALTVPCVNLFSGLTAIFEDNLFMNHWSPVPVRLTAAFTAVQIETSSYIQPALTYSRNSFASQPVWTTVSLSRSKLDI